MVNFTTYQTVAAMNFSNGTITTIWNYGGTLVNGLLSPLFLALAFFIIYSALAYSSFKEHAFAGSAFVVLIMATGLVGAGVMSPFYWLLVFALLIVGAYNSSKFNGP